MAGGTRARWGLQARISLAVVLASAVSGCSHQSEDGPDAWFSADPGRPAEPLCAGAPRLGDAPALRLGLVRSRGVPTKALGETVRLIRRFADLYGMKVTPAGERLQVIAGDTLLTTTVDEVNQALTEAGLGGGDGVARDPERVQAITSELTLAPARRLVTEHSAPGSVTLVLVARVTGAGSALGESLPALTLTPLAAAGSDVASVSRALGIEHYGPTVVIALEDLVGLTESQAGARLFHEIGHALGLVHTSDTANLMSPSRRRGCVATLDAGQIETVRVGLERLRSH